MGAKVAWTWIVTTLNKYISTEITVFHQIGVIALLVMVLGIADALPRPSDTTGETRPVVNNH